jgi:hypothetical protein
MSKTRAVVMSLCTFSGQLDSLLDHLDTGVRHTVLEPSLFIASAGNKMVSITVVARCSPGYKYLLH